MADTQVKAANLLLDRGIRVNIPDAPLIDKIRRRNKIHIRPLRGGTIAEIAILVLENGLNEPLTNTQLQARLEVISRILATAILNDKKRISIDRDKLADRLYWKCPAHMLIKIYRYIESLNELEVFTIITNYFSYQTKMMMARRTGQTEKGSQKSEHV